jgi:hypothetical protein
MRQWRVKAIEGKNGPYTAFRSLSETLKLGWKGASTLAFIPDGTSVPGVARAPQAFSQGKTSPVLAHVSAGQAWASFTAAHCRWEYA